MADWHVSESEGEGEDADRPETGPSPPTLTPLPHVDPKSLLELLIVIKRDKLLQLECSGKLNEEDDDGGTNRKGRKRKRKRRVKSQNISSGAGPSLVASSHVFVDVLSEGTPSSEVKSTRTASTSECRDSRRPTLSAFDYQHEDFGLDTKSNNKPRKCLPGLKKKMMTVQDIETTLRKEGDVRWRKEEEEEQPHPPDQPQYYDQRWSNSMRVMKGSDPAAGSSVTSNGNNNMTMHWEDVSDDSSIFDLDASFNSQEINNKISRIEQLLDND